MRPSQKNRSGRNKNGRKPMGNVVNRVFESAGPEGKVRGTPQQIIDKYLLLARDAQTSGDRVTAENFLQHAEHYIRLLNAAQEQSEERRLQLGGQPRSDQDERDEDDEMDEPVEGERAFSGESDRGFGGAQERPQGGFERRREPEGGRDPRPESRPEQRNDQRQEPRHEPRQEPRERRDERPRPQPQPQPLPFVASAGGLETIDPVEGEAPTLVATPEERAAQAQEPAPRRTDEPRRRQRRSPAPRPSVEAAADAGAETAESVDPDPTPSEQAPIG